VSDAFEKALQTGQPAIAAKAFQATIPEAHTSSNDCWIIVPVFYQYGLYYTEEGRRQCLQGYIIGIIDISIMLDSILNNTDNKIIPVQFHIVDVTDNRMQAPLYTDTDCYCSGLKEACMMS